MIRHKYDFVNECCPLKVHQELPTAGLGTLYPIYFSVDIHSSLNGIYRVDSRAAWEQCRYKAFFWVQTVPRANMIEFYSVLSAYWTIYQYFIGRIKTVAILYRAPW